LFFDSSGLVKRYVAETGTAWVIRLLRPAAANDIFIANITGIEVASAITRRLKIGSISQTTAKKALNRFKRDFTKRFIVVDLSRQIVEQGISLAEITVYAVTIRLNLPLLWLLKIACLKAE
jgi:predicted nucleic acid-binding protein